ncbi:tetratricopeptide repeat protein [Micromonospora sp. NPDC047620]|uniref:tetratricopeptide repeat protein n=1 Tax=Micromonospora sp. NPDC047620 TaxID=3364251 RepID=UPI0037105D10
MVRVESPAGRGSGYVIAPRLVLTSAHATSAVQTAVTLFRVGAAATATGRVVWRGSPGGRDDAALVLVEDPAWQPPAGGVPRWGRLVTNRPGIACQTWGFPAWVQRPERAADTWQPSGTVNPGNRYIGDRYVMAVTGYPPATANQTSPWAGLSGAGLFCGDLLTGVVAVDPVGGRHGYLEAVPAYVLQHDPEFRRVLAEYGGGSMLLDPVEMRELTEDEPPVGRSVAGLLRARQQVVGFRGREHLLQELQAWGQGLGFAAWLLHGPAGQGKTRLAQELAGRFGEQRWAWLWLRGHVPADALAVLADAAVPLLVIVDYAETRAEQVVAALHACARHSGATPVRMLLLARTAGDWWQQLQATDPHTEALLDGAPAVPLPPLEPDSGGRVDAYRQALTHLSRALAGMPANGGFHWELIADRLAAAASDPGPVSALAVQMKALADLLDAAVPAPATAGEFHPVTVEDRLLRHERRYWRDSAVARGLWPALTESALLDAMAAAMMLGADNRDAADTLLRGLPALADQSRDRRNAVRAWITHLYPAADARPWGALQPDRLAERFVGTRLADTPELVDPLVATATAGQVEQLLTVYARAAHHAGGGRLGPQLTALCVRHRDQLAVPAIEIATQVEAPSPLIAALQCLTAAPETPLGLLNTMADRAPQSSHNLAEWAAELSQRLTDEHRRLTAHDPDTFLPDLATALNNLSVRLADVGRYEDGLAAIEEAVEVYRELAQARPDTFLPDLAMSMNNLSLRLRDLSRYEEGLAAIDGSVKVYLELARARPRTFLPNLASAMINLSVQLGDVGRYEDGLAAIEVAVEAWRELAQTRPDAFLPDLASTLHNLSIQLGDLGRREDGLAASEEAVEVFRKLAQARPDAFLPDLASALNNLSVRLGDVGRYEDGLAAIEEAVEVFRKLAQARPEALLPNLANAMNNLSVRLRDVGRYEEGLAASEEAVEVYRKLTQARPDTFLPNLASAMNNLSVQLGDLGRREDGLAASEETVEVCRKLAQARPDTFLPNLASALHNLSNRLAGLGRYEDGLAASEEAVEVFRKLTRARPDTFLPNLASALHNLSIGLAGLGRYEDGLAASEEAVTIRRGLAAKWPDAHKGELEKSVKIRDGLKGLGGEPDPLPEA